MQSEFIQALKQSVPAEVSQISQTLTSAGFRAWIVGGSVRDVLLAVTLGHAPGRTGDWDLATDALPEQVQKLFRKVLPTGIQHGTVTIVQNRQHYEVTTLRGERGFSDGRRPDEVFFVDDLKEDLARRDFTVNAIAFSVTEGSLHDPFSGITDLQAGLLRAVGEPSQRFAEDGLRVLRGARFCSTLGMQLEEGTRRAIRPSLESFRKVSRERVRDEWWKALRSKLPSACFRVQREEGLLEILAPELWFEESAPASFEETLRALDHAAPEPTRRLALLLVGGLAGAPAQQAERARKFAAELRLSNQERDELERYLALRLEVLPSDPVAIRRWLKRASRAHARAQLDFLKELPASLGFPEQELLDFTERARIELESAAPLDPKELALTGKDLLDAGILKPGPALGSMLQRLFQEVLESPELNERERLLDRARSLTEKA